VVDAASAASGRHAAGEPEGPDPRKDAISAKSDKSDRDAGTEPDGSDGKAKGKAKGNLGDGSSVTGELGRFVPWVEVLRAAGNNFGFESHTGVVGMTFFLKELRLRC